VIQKSACASVYYYSFVLVTCWISPPDSRLSISTTKSPVCAFSPTQSNAIIETKTTFAMTTLQYPQQVLAPGQQMLDFEPTKMVSTLQEALDDLSLEGEDQTQCTDAESDDSSQAGSHFMHLKNIDGSQSMRSVEGNVHLKSSSILKQTESVSDKYIVNKRRAWKNLPAPDLDMIRQQSASSFCNTSSATRENRARQVTFGEVELRFYDQTLGDHPCTTYGPPISLDWTYEEAEPISLNEYEELRARRRTMKQMVLSYYDRKNTLRWCYGFKEADLKKASKECKKIAFQRGVTNYLLPVSKVEDFVTSAGRKAKRAVKIGGKRSSTI
jgi:hypothetical protein